MISSTLRGYSRLKNASRACSSRTASRTAGAQQPCGVVASIARGKGRMTSLSSDRVVRLPGIVSSQSTDPDWGETLPASVVHPCVHYHIAHYPINTDFGTWPARIIGMSKQRPWSDPIKHSRTGLKCQRTFLLSDRKCESCGRNLSIRNSKNICIRCQRPRSYRSSQRVNTTISV